MPSKDVKTYNAERQARHRAVVTDFKLSQGCTDCAPGTYWPPECLDFDHVRGSKKFNIGENVKLSLDRVFTEIAKCEVVCANHHRIRTEIRRKR